MRIIEMQRSCCYLKIDFSSEAVRCGASQKKYRRDSTKTYSPTIFTYSDVPQIAAYHEKSYLLYSFITEIRLRTLFE